MPWGSPVPDISKERHPDVDFAPSALSDVGRQGAKASRNAMSQGAKTSSGVSQCPHAIKANLMPIF